MTLEEMKLRTGKIPDGMFTSEDHRKTEVVDLRTTDTSASPDTKPTVGSVPTGIQIVDKGTDASKVSPTNTIATASNQSERHLDNDKQTNLIPKTQESLDQRDQSEDKKLTTSGRKEQHLNNTVEENTREQHFNSTIADIHREHHLNTTVEDIHPSNSNLIITVTASLLAVIAIISVVAIVTTRALRRNRRQMYNTSSRVNVDSTIEYSSLNDQNEAVSTIVAASDREI